MYDPREIIEILFNAHREYLAFYNDFYYIALNTLNQWLMNNRSIFGINEIRYIFDYIYRAVIFLGNKRHLVPLLFMIEDFLEKEEENKIINFVPYSVLIYLIQWNKIRFHKMLGKYIDTEKLRNKSILAIKIINEAKKDILELLEDIHEFMINYKEEIKKSHQETHLFRNRFDEDQIDKLYHYALNIFKRISVEDNAQERVVSIKFLHVLFPTDIPILDNQVARLLSISADKRGLKRYIKIISGFVTKELTDEFNKRQNDFINEVKKRLRISLAFKHISLLKILDEAFWNLTNNLKDDKEKFNRIRKEIRETKDEIKFYKIFKEIIK